MAKKFSQTIKIKRRLIDLPKPTEETLVVPDTKVKEETKEEELPKKKGIKRGKVTEENVVTEEITEINN
jgi:hypothetical protein